MVRRTIVEATYLVEADSVKAAAALVLDNLIEAGEPDNEHVIRATIRRVRAVHEATGAAGDADSEGQ